MSFAPRAIGRYTLDVARGSGGFDRFPGPLDLLGYRLLLVQIQTSAALKDPLVHTL